MCICTVVGKPIWVYYSRETDEEQSMCAQIWPLRCCQHQSNLPNDTICTNGNSSIGILSSRADLVKLLKEYCIWRDWPLQRWKTLVLLHGPLRLCRIWSFTGLRGKREWGSELPHLFGSPSRTSMSWAVFQTVRTISFPCTSLAGFLLVSYPQWGQLKDPGSGLHYRWIARALQGSDLGFLISSGKACLTSSWPAEKEPDTLAQLLKWFLWTHFCVPCHPKE